MGQLPKRRLTSLKNTRCEHGLTVCVCVCVCSLAGITTAAWWGPCAACVRRRGLGPCSPAWCPPSSETPPSPGSTSCSTPRPRPACPQVPVTPPVRLLCRLTRRLWFLVEVMVKLQVVIEVLVKLQVVEASQFTSGRSYSQSSGKTTSCDRSSTFCRMSSHAAQCCVESCCDL